MIISLYVRLPEFIIIVPAPNKTPGISIIKGREEERKEGQERSREGVGGGEKRECRLL